MLDGRGPIDVPTLLNDSAKENHAWIVRLTYDFGNLNGALHAPPKFPLARSHVRGVERDRWQERKVSVLYFFNLLGQEVGLPFEYGGTGEDEMSVRRVALVPRLVEVEEIQGKKRQLPTVDRLELAKRKLWQLQLDYIMHSGCKQPAVRRNSQRRSVPRAFLVSRTGFLATRALVTRRRRGW